MNNLVSEIIEGWKNFAFKNPKVEEIATKRAEQCVNCTIKGKPVMKNKKFCGICGCYIPAKVRSLSSKCPLGKW